MKNNNKLLKYVTNGEIPKKAGVYLLENRKTGKVYIGCTMNLRARIAAHRSLLLSKRHYSSELQQTFDRDILLVKVIAILPHATPVILREAELLLIQASPHLFPAGLINKRLINFSINN